MREMFKMKKDYAFSGLEAAIVLIAFVVVAAVFSYVMLGAGFFATQKSQEVTYSGVKQSTSNLVIDGQVYGSTAPIQYITFSISIPEGSQPQSLETIEFVTTSTASAEPNEATVDFFDYEGDPVAASTVMRPGDKYTVRVTMDPRPAAGESFTIEMKPKIGAATLISKTLSTGYEKGVII